MAVASIKGFVSRSLLDPDGEAPPPAKPAPPKGKLKLFNNWFKLLALLGLAGYFLFLFADLIINYIKDVNEPPLQVSQKLGEGQFKTAEGVIERDPFFPAIAICNTALNKTIKLLAVTVGLVVQKDSLVACLPEQGNDNCAADFPVDRTFFWAFNVRNANPSAPSGRRLFGNAASTNKKNLRSLQGSSADEIPQTNGEWDQNCIAADLSRLSGFEIVDGEPLRRAVQLLFAYQPVGNDTSLVHTIGLDGVDVYYFNDPTKIPGADDIDVGNTAGNTFQKLYVDQKPLLSGRLMEDLTDDTSVLGRDQISFTSLSQSRTFIAKSKINQTEYKPTAITAPLARGQFASPANPEVTDPAFAVSGIQFTYSTRLIKFFTNEPPSFAVLLGAIGGLKSIFTNFWAAGIVALLVINGIFSARQQKTAVATKGDETTIQVAQVQ